MPETVSIEHNGAERARETLERCISAGGLAVFPADTVYGLACDPRDESAVGRVHELKGREPGKPSAVMFFSPLAMRELLASLGPRTREAIGALLPGPLTLVVTNPQRRYPLACGEDPERLGVRLIDGPLAGARCPVLQTSANPGGQAAPRSVEEIEGSLRSGVDLIIDAGELPGTPSTVVDLSAIESGGAWRLLREGPIGQRELEKRLAALGG